MLVIGVIIIALLGALVFVLKMQNNKTVSSDENPYGDKPLKQETIDLIGNPLYDNIILPEDLEKELKSEDKVTVYFFSPTCIHCINATPIVDPLTKAMEIDMKKMNTLEYEEEKAKYEIVGTPTIVHFENGEEVARFEGAAETEEEYREFFEEFVK